MKKDIADFVAKFPNCQSVQVEHVKPSGLTQIIEVPTWKWEAINMDFRIELLKTRRHQDSICVIVDRMTKSAHFIPMKSTYRPENYARLYIDEIVKWHGIPLPSISDSTAQFTSRFWRFIKKNIDTQVNHSTLFHPKTDGKVDLTI